MTIEQALWQHVTGNAGVSALVGTRVYPIVLRQTQTFPAVTFQRIATPRVTTHDGPSGLAAPVFQFDSWGLLADGFDDISNVGDALRQALDGYHGQMAAVSVQQIILTDERDTYEADVTLWRRTQEYVIWHCEHYPIWH